MQGGESALCRWGTQRVKHRAMRSHSYSALFRIQLPTLCARPVGLCAPMRAAVIAPLAWALSTRWRVAISGAAAATDKAQNHIPNGHDNEQANLPSPLLHFEVKYSPGPPDNVASLGLADSQTSTAGLGLTAIALVLDDFVSDESHSGTAVATGSGQRFDAHSSMGRAWLTPRRPHPCSNPITSWPAT